MPEPCKSTCGEGSLALSALTEAAGLLWESSSSIAAPSWPVLEGVLVAVDVHVCRAWAGVGSADAHCSRVSRLECAAVVLSTEPCILV